MTAAENFIQWALSPDRTLEQRYLVELMCEHGVRMWRARRKDYFSEPWEVVQERNRQRKLNPAYTPTYAEVELRQAAEVLVEEKDWRPSMITERPIRDLSALRFMAALEKLNLPGTEAADLSPLTDLPNLRELHFYSATCEDFGALAACKGLRVLSLGFGRYWPRLNGLDELEHLETLNLTGNLLAMPDGVVYPHVRRASLSCKPLPAPSVASLPHLPACEFLKLDGAWRLDGIESSPLLRNLTLGGPFASFAPLTALKALTWLTVETHGLEDCHHQPLDLHPLAHMEKLHYFRIGSPYLMNPPRDYSPLAEAPELRELIVENCPPVEMEVAAIRAGLLPWDDLLLAPEPPGPLPPLKIYVAPASKHPHRPLPNRAPGEPDLIDTGLRECEASWVSRYVEQRISERLGHSDWGEAKASGESRHLFVTIESFEAIPRFLDIIAAMREAMASLRYDYEGAFMIALRTPRAEPTPAQQAMIEEAQEEEDKADFERWQRERAEYLERKHRYELKKQDGSEINPEEFAPGPENWEGEEEGDDDDSDDEEFEDQDDSDLADDEEEVDVLSLLDDDDEHPLADEYRILADIKGNTVWFVPHQRTLAVQLMGREPDEEYPDDET